MNFAKIVVLAILLHAANAYSQTAVLPYLKNGLYGIADTQGKIIVEPQYEDVRFYYKHLVGAFQKNGLWGIMDTHGKILLSNQVKVEVKPRDESNLGALITAVFDTTYKNYSGGQYINIHLYKITDKFARVEYYVNPFHPVSNPQRFYPADNLPNRYGSGNSSQIFRTGLIMVATVNSMVNFIDTTGQVILDTEIYDGFAMTDRFIAFKNENREFALYDREKKTATPYVYSDITMGDRQDYIILHESAKNKYKKTLLNLDGTPLQSQVPNAFSFTEKYIIVNDSASVRLLDRSGKKQFEIPGGYLSTPQYTRDHFILKKNEKYGIVNAKGDALLEPSYDELQSLNQNYYSFRKGKLGGIMDAGGKIIWQSDSVIVFQEFTRFPELFQVKRESGYTSTFGVADIKGKILIRPVYKRIEPHHTLNLFTVFADTTSAVFSTDGKEIVPFSKSYKEIDTQTRTITSTIVGMKFIYDLSGNQLQAEKRYGIGLKVSSNAGTSQLVDFKGNPYGEQFMSIRESHDDKSRRQFFIAKRSETDKRIYILNDQAQSIIPKEYIFVDQMRNSSYGPVANGSVIVVHEQDVLTGKRPFRSGAVNLDGAWVIEPAYQAILLINRELFAVYSMDRKKSVLYNRDGKKISEKQYIFHYSNRERELDYPRVIVAQRSVPKEDELLFEKETPDLKMGVIDLEGNEIVPLMYSSIDSYEHPYTVANGTDKSGAKFSSLIDLNGKELLRIRYDDLYILTIDSSLLLTVSGTKKGLMRTNGEILIEPVWNEVELLPVKWNLRFYIMKDSADSYIYFPGKPRSRIGPVTDIHVEELQNSYYGVYWIAKEGQLQIKHMTIFDEQGNSFGEYAGAEIKRYYLGGEGYISITDNKGDLPYVVDFKTKREFRSR
ncbi:MAG TPA: WG repeat-containing protein [Saprospiraceae bacterium]|nr:WG repeat-containing protein [Saprospiraceae bacterium]